MEKIKIINIKSNIVKEVSKTIASDYIGTKEWKTYEPKKETIKEISNKRFNLEEK